MKKFFVVLLIAVLVAGCDGSGTTQKVEEKTASFPTLEFSKLGYEPTTLSAGDVFVLNATIENSAGGDASLRDVEGEFYNFGSYLDTCSKISGGRSNLGGGEQAAFSCMTRVKPLAGWPDKTKASISEDIKFKVSYYYDLALTMDGIKVLEETEFDRTKPKTAVESKSVGAPLAMTLDIESTPVKEGEPFTIRLSFAMPLGEDEGIEDKGVNKKYQIGMASVSVPSSFVIVNQGDFASTRPCGESTCLEATYIVLQEGKGQLEAQVKVPRMKTPEDSFAIQAFATSFKIFKIQGVTVSAESKKLA